MSYFVKANGRVLGTANRYESLDSAHVQHIGFKPGVGVPLVAGVLAIDFEDGSYDIWAGETIIVSGDIFSICAGLPRAY